MDAIVKIFCALFLIISVFALFGCTSTPVCGDNLCSSGEENNCPTDCVAAVKSLGYNNLPIPDSNVNNPLDSN